MVSSGDRIKEEEKTRIGKIRQSLATEESKTKAVVASTHHTVVTDSILFCFLYDRPSGLTIQQTANAFPAKYRTSTSVSSFILVRMGLI